MSRNFMNCFQRACVAWMVLLVLANRGLPQEPTTQNTNVALQPGEVNLQFSRVFILVDKSGLAGHQHAVEGKLKRGQLFSTGGQKSSLLFDMKSFDADTLTARKYLGLSGATDEATRKKVNENMLGIQIRCDLEEKDGWHHLRGAFKILQSDYGIKPFSKMMGAVGVKDELVILGDLWVVPSR